MESLPSDFLLTIAGPRAIKEATYPATLLLETAPCEIPDVLTRPLPTPARARAPPPVQASYLPAPTHLMEASPPNPRGSYISTDAQPPAATAQSIHLGVLSTLLEDSRRSSDDYPLYLAATLLEAVFEHHSSAQDKLCPAKLSLVDALPADHSAVPLVHPAPWPKSVIPKTLLPMQATLLLGGTDLGFTLHQAALFLQPKVRFGDFGNLLGRLPTSLAQSLCSTFPTATPASPLLCFVDGSYTPAANGGSPLLGWACVYLDPEQSSISIVSGSGPRWFVCLRCTSICFCCRVHCYDSCNLDR